MENKKIKKNNETGVRFIGAILVILLFSLLTINYYFPEFLYGQDSRIVKADYKSLEREANTINFSPSNEPAENVFVLTYHRVTKGEPTRDFELSFEQFKENMFALKKAGYQTVTTADLYAFMKGEKQLPDKSFILTFDDGARQSYYNADPILKALNYTAVIFVITGHAINENASTYYLDETELKEAQNTSRWEIESHTYYSHFRLPINEDGVIAPALTNKLWMKNESRMENDEEYFNRVSEDLKLSKTLLEERLNLSINSLALPYGDFGEKESNYWKAKDILHDLSTENYDLVFYEFPSKSYAYRANYPNINQSSYLISRIAADSHRDPERLLRLVESTRIVHLPYYEDYSHPEKWIRTIGEASFTDNAIIFSQRDSNTEIIMSYLDGSYLLKDYNYSVQLKNSAASKVSLISRYNNPKDYVSCMYGNGFISIEKANPQSIVNQVQIDENLMNQPILTMSIKGSNVSCSINGKIKISGEIEGIPDYGGVGIKAENFETNDKTFVIGNISVLEI